MRDPLKYTEDRKSRRDNAQFFNGKTVLALPEDKSALSPLRCFLRENGCFLREKGCFLIENGEFLFREKCCFFDRERITIYLKNSMKLIFFRLRKNCDFFSLKNSVKLIKFFLNIFFRLPYPSIWR